MNNDIGLFIAQVAQVVKYLEEVDEEDELQINTVPIEVLSVGRLRMSMRKKK